MGLARYYLCPCYRYKYDPTRSAYDDLSEEEKAKKDREFALAKRAVELAVKNPETAPWQKYEKKAIPSKGGNTSFLQTNIIKSERARELRQESRAERRAVRRMDEDLFLKPRMTVSGIDI